MRVYRLNDRRTPAYEKAVRELRALHQSVPNIGDALAEVDAERAFERWLKVTGARKRQSSRPCACWLHRRRSRCDGWISRAPCALPGRDHEGLWETASGLRVICDHVYPGSADYTGRSLDDWAREQGISVWEDPLPDWYYPGATTLRVFAAEEAEWGLVAPYWEGKYPIQPDYGRRAEVDYAGETKVSPSVRADFGDGVCRLLARLAACPLCLASGSAWNPGRQCCDMGRRLGAWEGRVVADAVSSGGA